MVNGYCLDKEKRSDPEDGQKEFRFSRMQICGCDQFNWAGKVTFPIQYL